MSEVELEQSTESSTIDTPDPEESGYVVVGYDEQDVQEFLASVERPLRKYDGYMPMEYWDVTQRRLQTFVYYHDQFGDRVIDVEKRLDELIARLGYDKCTHGPADKEAVNAILAKAENLALEGKLTAELIESFEIDLYKAGHFDDVGVKHAISMLGTVRAADYCVRHAQDGKLDAGEVDTEVDGFCGQLIRTPAFWDRLRQRLREIIADRTAVASP